MVAQKFPIRASGVGADGVEDRRDLEPILRRRTGDHLKRIAVERVHLRGEMLDDLALIGVARGSFGDRVVVPQCFQERRRHARGGRSVERCHCVSVPIRPDVRAKSAAVNITPVTPTVTTLPEQLATLTTGEAAAYLTVSPETIRRWVAAGELRAIRLTSRSPRRVIASDVEEFRRRAFNTEEAVA